MLEAFEDYDLRSFGLERLHALNELCTREIARKIITPGSMAIDLGANEGFHTRDFSRLAGPQGIVHAFEPNPSMWSGLLGLDQVRLWPVAVGNENTVESFFLPTDNNRHQVGSLVDPRDFLGEIPVKILSVPQMAIDSILEIADQKPVFIKADVERRELQAFQGGIHYLERHRPVIIYENNTATIESLLNSVGYRIFPLALVPFATRLANWVALPPVLSIDPGATLLTTNEFEKIVSWVITQYPQLIATESPIQ